MFIFQALLLIIIGHFTAALLVYLNHRFVFHGKLGKTKVLKPLTRYHALHHKHAWGARMPSYIIMPKWARFFFTWVYVGVAWLSFPFAMGLLSFSLYYAYNHLAIHRAKHYGHSYYHHTLHHMKPKWNFSGMYPFIDKLFSSYIESRPKL
tara:strand:+ start:792 stop:1241 length:450 start_codon:yes stop_codon:yes gene_type:complete